MSMVDGLSGGDMSRVESEFCPGVGGYTMGPEINPPVLTPSGGHQNTYGWQADGTHPTGMFSCVNYGTDQLNAFLANLHAAGSPKLEWEETESNDMLLA